MLIWSFLHLECLLNAWLISSGLGTGGPYAQQRWSVKPTNMSKARGEYAHAHVNCLRAVGWEHVAAKRAARMKTIGKATEAYEDLPI